jgi:hypothetical protein
MRRARRTPQQTTARAVASVNEEENGNGWKK